MIIGVLMTYITFTCTYYNTTMISLQYIIIINDFLLPDMWKPETLRLLSSVASDHDRDDSDKNSGKTNNSNLV